MTTGCPIVPGVRVIRGPNWQGGESDGGDGRLGTVLEVLTSEGSKGKVRVYWDCGMEGEYAAGKGDKYELRAYDSGPAGISHSQVTCNGCRQHPIGGFRWKCAACQDFDLCNLCYHGDKHDVSHPFYRYDSETATVVKVDPRDRSRKKELYGLLPGAKVMRGIHWQYGDQDKDQSGNHKVGEITEVGTWTGGLRRGGVRVLWEGSTERSQAKGYRVGPEGKVDLVAMEEGQFGHFYVDHLPKVDVLHSVEIKLKAGDKVVVNTDFETFKKLHQEHSIKWNRGMKQCVEEVGTVVRVNDPSYFKAQYQDAQTWYVLSAAVDRVHTFKKGDIVRVLDNYNAVMELQQGHGGWNDKMEAILGKLGRVMKVDGDGDLTVRLPETGTREWFLSPVVCSLEPGAHLSDNFQPSQSSGTPGQEADALQEGVAKLLMDILRERPELQPEETLTSHQLFKAINSGDLNAVRTILEQHEDIVHQTLEGKTPLHLACLKGHMEVASLIMDKGADLNQPDSDGDTPLHFSVSGEHMSLVEVLLKKGVSRDAKNTRGLTSLHYAVTKKHAPCLQLLVSAGCDVNTQDCENDTPFHDALREEEYECIKILLDVPSLDVRTFNDEGYTGFHTAVVKNNTMVVEALLLRDRELAQEKSRVMGCSPLHIAVANGSLSMAGILLGEGKADVNTTDSEGRTPLYLAVCQNNLQMVELLLDSNADQKIADKDGNTPLHASYLPDHRLPNALATMAGPQGGKFKVACLLVERGGEVMKKNNAGETFYDLVNMQNPQMAELFQRMASMRQGGNEGTLRVRMPAHWQNMEGQEMRLIDVTAEDEMLAEDFRAVVADVTSTLSNREVVQIQRVQNVKLWEKYSQERHRLEQKLGQGRSNEKRLFHGTSPEGAKAIPSKGLDFRPPPDKDMAAFGDGAYFARDAKYADAFSVADGSGLRVMVLARVLVGEYREGSQGLKQPPALAPSDPSSLANAAVDNKDNPRVFVIFPECSGQVYPEYLIKYR